MLLLSIVSVLSRSRSRSRSAIILLLRRRTVGWILRRDVPTRHSRLFIEEVPALVVLVPSGSPGVRDLRRGWRTRRVAESRGWCGLGLDLGTGSLVVKFRVDFGLEEVAEAHCVGWLGGDGLRYGKKSDGGIDCEFDDCRKRARTLPSLNTRESRTTTRAATDPDPGPGRKEMIIPVRIRTSHQRAETGLRRLRQ